MAVVVGVTFLVAEGKSGEIVSELPLSSVTLSSELRAPGTMRASLDLRKVVAATGRYTYDWTDAARVMDMLTAQRHTIVPTLLDTTNGEQATTDRCLGEWWIEDVSGSHSNPVVTLAGHEFPEYFRRQQIARTWSGNVDPVHTLREMMHDATTAQEPDVLLDVLRGSTSALRVDVEWQARSVSVLDAARELGGGTTFEWIIQPTLQSVNGVPSKVTRQLVLRAPRIELGDKDYLPLEVLTPGKVPASGLDVDWSSSVDHVAHEMWSFGAGSGADQVRSGVVTTPPDAVPTISRVVTDPTVTKGTQATVLARNARDALTRQPFTVRVDGARMVPTVGGLRWFSREPSLSMPTGDQFTVRVVAWTWNQPGAGELDTYDVTLERV